MQVLPKRMAAQAETPGQKRSGVEQLSQLFGDIVLK